MMSSWRILGVVFGGTGGSMFEARPNIIQDIAIVGWVTLLPTDSPKASPHKYRFCGGCFDDIDNRRSMQSQELVQR